MAEVETSQLEHHYKSMPGVELRDKLDSILMVIKVGKEPMPAIATLVAIEMVLRRSMRNCSVISIGICIVDCCICQALQWLTHTTTRGKLAVSSYYEGREISNDKTPHVSSNLERSRQVANA